MASTLERSFQLGVLDFCWFPDSRKPADGIWQAIELAPLLESFGYHRYWLTEHHNSDVAHSSPEILMPVLAGRFRPESATPAGLILLPLPIIISIKPKILIKPKSDFIGHRLYRSR